MLFSLAVIFLVGLSAAAIFQTIGLPEDNRYACNGHSHRHLRSQSAGS